jgi:peptide deformylase
MSGGAVCSRLAQIIIYPDARLNLPATRRPVDAAMLAAGEALRMAANEAQAYGLAAAHIGLAEPLVVISTTAPTDRRDYRILYNPEVILTALETATGAEGSVSMPGIEVPIARSLWAEVAYETADGARQTARFEGFVARVALHEVDQMNGIFFLSRLSRVKRDTAIRKFEKSLRR